MKATDFAFWLQGHFELNGEGATLTRAQAQFVLKKAETVQPGSSEVELKAQSFVSYAQGILFAAGGATDDSFLKPATAELKSKLNNLFAHAIDPSIPGDQEKFRQTHRPGGPKRGDIEVLC